MDFNNTVSNLKKIQKMGRKELSRHVKKEQTECVTYEHCRAGEV